MAHKKAAWLFVWLFLLVLCLVILRLTNIVLTGQAVVPANPQDQTVIIAQLRDGLRINGKAGAYYKYRATLTGNLFMPSRLHILPDGCISQLLINGVIYRLEQGQACDRYNGFTVTVSPGKILDIRASIFDNGGETGLFVKPVSELRTAAALLFALLAVTGTAGIFLAAGAGKRIAFLAGLAVLVRLIYLTHTPYYARTYDVEGHIDYITYIAGRGVLPPIAGGWEYYQPPLYYAVSAIVYLINGWLGIANQYYTLQIFSLTLFVGFLLIVYKILNYRNSLRGVALFTAFAMIAFWPTAIIHSVRIGNDVMLYGVYAASLYSGIRFLDTRRRSDLLIAFLLAGLSLLVKSNGLALLAVLTVAIMSAPLSRLWVLKNKRIFLLSILAASVFLLVNAIRLSGNSHADPFIANIANLNSGLRVTNTFSHMVSFDVYNFVTHPFASGWDDATGRQQFFTFLWKTSLFSENFDGPLARQVASAIMVLFLGLSAYPIAGIILAVRQKLILKPVPLMLVSSGIILLAVSFAARLRYPFAPTGDFRYIFPFLISYVYFFGLALTYSSRKGRLFAWLPIAAASLFVILGALVSVTFS